MAWPNKWSDWWRGFLGFSRDGRYKAIEILRQQYVEANQRASQLRRHAQNMPYPQFREKLLRITADESRHGDQIAEVVRPSRTRASQEPTRGTFPQAQRP